MKNQHDRYLSNIATTLVVSLATLPAFAADENPFKAQVVQPTSAQQKLVQGMCGGRWEGRCGGMMDGMMMGGSMPPTLDPAQLPEPTAAGAKLLTQYCTQCHGLPSPKQHSADGWPMTVTRMYTRMQWMDQNSAMGIKAPTEVELKTLLSYLQTHAADVEELMPPDVQDKR